LPPSGKLSAMKHRAIFFCGDRSPYGLAHLKPVLDLFEILAVVVADGERWTRFRKTLSGEERDRQQATPRAAAGRLLGRIALALRGASGEERGLVRVSGFPVLPLWRVFDVNERSFLDRVRAVGPEIILSAAYPQIFSRELIAIPSRGSVNFHPSLLPRYRGAHPHFWAIAMGEKESGLTAHLMTEEIDAGDVVAQISYPIGSLDYGQLYEKMIAETPSIVREVALFFREGRRAVPQESSRATRFRNDREIHRKVFWNLHTAEEIRNLARTGTAFCFFRNERIGIVRVGVAGTNRNLTNDVRVEPGTIVDLGPGGVVVKAIDACVVIRDFVDGSNTLSHARWTAVKRAWVGEKFG
jgi:methionyl-tRNA formyltransferase